MSKIITILIPLAIAAHAPAGDSPGQCLSNQVSFDADFRTTSASGRGTRVVVGDLNQDGFDDIVTVDHLGEVRVLRSRGDGLFTEFTVIDKLGQGPAFHLALGDVDDDGWLDLLALTSPETQKLFDTLVVYRWRQGGGFAPPLTFQLPGTSSALATLDFQMDGETDIAISFDDLLRVYTLDETLALVELEHSPFETADEIRRLDATADFNADGANDLLVIFRRHGRKHLVSTSGVLGLTAAFPNHATFVDAQPADMDGDGIVDIVVATSGSDDPKEPFDQNVVYYLGRGDGTFQGTVVHHDFSEIPISAFTTGDFNADGRGDLVMSGRMSALISQGEFGFEEVPYANADGGDILLTADLNGDSRPDIVGTYIDSHVFDLMVYSVLTACACTSDYNQDGATDATDLAVMLADWGGTDADLNGDGVTSSADIALLLAAWGECP